MFKKNLDKKGRLIRLIIACLLVIYALWEHSWIAFGVSLFVFFETFMSWCMVYQILGINQCPIKNENKKTD